MNKKSGTKKTTEEKPKKLSVQKSPIKPKPSVEAIKSSVEQRSSAKKVVRNSSQKLRLASSSKKILFQTVCPPEQCVELVEPEFSPTKLRRCLIDENEHRQQRKH